MDFCKKLTNYMEEIDCSALELSIACELSKSTISRYCGGLRMPLNPSIELNKLIKGLTTLAKDKNIKTINEETIKKDFSDIIKNYDMEKIVNNFNQLVSSLKINIADFSKKLGFDASYLSRIRAGKRKPADPKMFLEAICNYITSSYNDHNSKIIISTLTEQKISESISIDDYKKIIGLWLCSDYQKNNDQNDINNFLEKLNDFDLNEYIKVIHFDKLKVPTIPFKIPKSKNYYGIEEMKQGELDFFKGTILSKAKGDVFMCSDMPIEDMAKDLDFGKKWMFAIAMSLKKGLHLNIIHNIDRPFKEMMIGLESWIPIYMTGQVSPYYLNNVQDNIYAHFNYVSDSVALTGECIKGYHTFGKYYLTNNKSEVSYYQEKAKYLLKKAHPLMKIYLKENKKQFDSFLEINTTQKGNWNVISQSLPIHTINHHLLIKILKRNKINNNDIHTILEFLKKEQNRIKCILKENKMQENINKINQQEFEKSPISLELTGLFYSKKILYTYQEYLEHFELTKEYEKKNNNYSLLLNETNAFKNIKITIYPHKWVMLSKCNNPTIHFVIEHPKLCHAIENFVVPIIEKE